MTPRAPMWVEPALALLLFICSVVIQPELSLQAWAVAVVLVGAASLSGAAPLAATVLSVVGSLLLLLLDPNDVPAASIAPAITVFALYRAGPRHRMALSIAMLVASCAALVMHGAGDRRELVLAGTLVTGLFVLAAGMGWVVRLGFERANREHHLAGMRVASMRAQLARELHDTVAQTLSHAALRARMAALDEDTSARLRGELERIADDCAASAGDLRQLLGVLRAGDESSLMIGAPIMGTQELHEVIDKQAGDLRERGFDVDVSFDLDAVTPMQATTLAKITVEAVTNIAKHAAPGTPATISLARADGGLTAAYANEVADDAERGTGLGLSGISERAGLVNGRATFAHEGTTWRVEVFLPDENNSSHGN